MSKKGAMHSICVWVEDSCTQIIQSNTVYLYINSILFKNIYVVLKVWNCLKFAETNQNWSVITYQNYMNQTKLLTNNNDKKLNTK